MGKKRINSRAKGVAGERDWRDFLRSHGIQARRGAQYQGGTESPDVVSEDLPLWHFEVKRTEALSIYTAMSQAIEDSGGRKFPCVAHRRNGKEWLVVLRADDFIKTLKMAGFVVKSEPTVSPLTASSDGFLACPPAEPTSDPETEQ